MCVSLCLGQSHWNQYSSSGPDWFDPAGECELWAGSNGNTVRRGQTGQCQVIPHPPLSDCVRLWSRSVTGCPYISVWNLSMLKHMLQAANRVCRISFAPLFFFFFSNFSTKRDHSRSQLWRWHIVDPLLCLRRRNRAFPPQPGTPFPWRGRSGRKSTPCRTTWLRSTPKWWWPSSPVWWEEEWRGPRGDARAHTHTDWPCARLNGCERERGYVVLFFVRD